MEAEPIVAQADADMTIDYDQPLHAVSGAPEASGDAEMGLDVMATHDGSVMAAANATQGLEAAPITGTMLEPTEQEADMRDDGSVPEGDVNIVDDSGPAGVEVMLEDHVAEPTMPVEAEATASEPLIDVAFTGADEATMTSATIAPLDPVITAAPLVGSDLTANATLAPEPAFATASEVVLPDEPLALDGPAAPAEPIGQDAAIDPATSIVTTVGDGGAAARDLELPEPGTASESLGDAEADLQTANADSTRVHAEEEPLDEGVPPLFEIASEKLAEQVEEAQAHGRDSELASSNARPAVDKNPLVQVEIPAEDFAPEASTSAARFAPGVLVTCGGTTYCLFRQLRVANESSFTEDDDDEEEGAIKSSDEDRSTTEEDAPMIFDELAQHDLYYQPVERLLETLRSTLPELDGEADELVLDFEDLGITLGEDNIYTRQVSLFDFDRLHLGCQIPGRLHVRVYAQPRFASGFNALAQHIASTYSPDGPREEDDVHEEQAEEEQEGVADDYDGPDSELPSMAAAEDEVNANAAEAAEQTRGENDDENDEEEEFDLESALAQLDQDNIIAVVEGAQEDLMTDMPPQQEEEEGEEVEGAVDETSDGEQQEEAGDEHAGAQETAQEEGEEPSVEGPDAGEESWQIVDAEEASDEPTGEAAATITDAHGHDAAPFVNGSPPAADSAAEAQQTDTEAEQAADVAGGFKEADNADGRAEQTAKIDAETAIEADVEQDAPVTEAEHAQIDAAVADDAGAANGVPQASEGESHWILLTPSGPTPNLCLQGPADIPDTTADGADVVIDYDEAFDPTSVSEEPESAEQDSADVTAATSTSTRDAPPSPKRSRSFDQVVEVNGAGEDSANDAKRPRLAETSEAEVAVQAAS